MSVWKADRRGEVDRRGGENIAPLKVGVVGLVAFLVGAKGHVDVVIGSGVGII